MGLIRKLEKDVYVMLTYMDKGLREPTIYLPMLAH